MSYEIRSVCAFIGRHVPAYAFLADSFFLWILLASVFFFSMSVFLTCVLLLTNV